MPKMQSTVRLSSPVQQDIEVSCRYDEEWECWFMTILSGEVSPHHDKPIYEEVTICFNNKKELDKFKKMFKKATKKIK